MADVEEIGKKATDLALSDNEDSDGEHPGESEVEKEMRKEIVCREKMIRAKEKYGPDHERYIFWALKLVDYLIPQYKLNDTEVVLDEIMPACKKLGGNSYIKAIQSKAFNLFKQYKFKESLACFLEQEKLVGPSALLYENLAHVYNSIGNYEEAARYFTLANSLIDQGAFGKKGGILLGLGLVKERQGLPAEALPILKEALDFYKKEVGSDDGGSIIAKAHMSVGQCHEILLQLDEAVVHIKAAVDIFTKTTGASPLTANSLGVLGRILLAQARTAIAALLQPI
jgi:tetratricopeptide (TPR) repeat protein